MFSEFPNITNEPQSIELVPISLSLFLWYMFCFHVFEQSSTSFQNKLKRMSGISTKSQKPRCAQTRGSVIPKYFYPDDSSYPSRWFLHLPHINASCFILNQMIRLLQPGGSSSSNGSFTFWARRFVNPKSPNIIKCRKRVSDTVYLNVMVFR